MLIGLVSHHRVVREVGTMRNVPHLLCTADELAKALQSFYVQHADLSRIAADFFGPVLSRLLLKLRVL